MNFINPSFLWALFALAIPVVIHLFHFRRYKTVYFSNVNFLKEVKQERNNIQQIKRWLLLLSRLLALSFLVFAFAQPYLKGKNNDVAGTKAVSIYLDNSYSMGLKNKGVELIEWGRDRAEDVVKSYSEKDEFLILTNDLKVEEQRWKSKEDALTYIESIELSSKSLPLETIVQKQQYLFTKSNGSQLKNYVISDFQQSSLQNFEIEKDTSQAHYFVQLQADNVKNIYVDSVWMVDPINRLGNGNTVLYKIKNSSELDAQNLRVTLTINEQVQTISELNLMPNEERNDTLFFNIFKEGWQLAEISISDYPITVDDNFYFSFEVKKTRKVLEIYDGATSNIIRSVFENDDFIELERKPSNQLDYSSFQNYDLIVLNELENVSSGLVNASKKYTETGGNVLFIPSDKAQISSYNTFLSTLANVQIGEEKSGNYTLQKPNLTNQFIKGIVADFPSNTNLPTVKQYYPIVANTRIRQQTILSLNNNDALLANFPINNGNLFIQTVPNSSTYSAFQSHWSYAPIIYNIALAQGLGETLYQVSGEEEWTVVNNKLDRKDNVVAVSGDEIDFIPEQRVVNNRLLINTSKNDQLASGHYKVYLGEETLAYLSMNLNRMESEMKFASEEELKQAFPNVQEVSSGLKATAIQNIKLNNEGKPLWKICLLLALLFIIIEVLIIRLMPD